MHFCVLVVVILCVPSQEIERVSISEFLCFHFFVKVIRAEYSSSETTWGLIGKVFYTDTQKRFVLILLPVCLGNNHGLPSRGRVPHSG